jgi:hypothetical protein
MFEADTSIHLKDGGLPREYDRVTPVETLTKRELRDLEPAPRDEVLRSFELCGAFRNIRASNSAVGPYGSMQALRRLDPFHLKDCRLEQRSADLQHF